MLMIIDAFGAARVIYSLNFDAWSTSRAVFGIGNGWYRGNIAISLDNIFLIGHLVGCSFFVSGLYPRREGLKIMFESHMLATTDEKPRRQVVDKIFFQTMSKTRRFFFLHHLRTTQLFYNKLKCQAEGEKEEELYNKFMCYCKGNTGIFSVLNFVKRRRRKTTDGGSGFWMGGGKTEWWQGRIKTENYPGRRKVFLGGGLKQNNIAAKWPKKKFTNKEFATNKKEGN